MRTPVAGLIGKITGQAATPAIAASKGIPRALGFSLPRPCSQRADGGGQPPVCATCVMRTGNQSAATGAENGEVFSVKLSHGCYRSFSVASPTSAKMSEAIQKRVIT